MKIDLLEISEKYHISLIIDEKNKTEYLIDTNTQGIIFIPFKEVHNSCKSNVTVYCIDFNNNFYYIDCEKREIILKLDFIDYIPSQFYGNSKEANNPYLWLENSTQSSSLVDILIYDLRTKECVLHFNSSYRDMLYNEDIHNFKNEKGLNKLKMKMFLEGRLL